MKDTVELLAPAGSYESFLAAIENGANAIYLGGKLFNARANASNFSIDELKEMVKYAHLRGVKIHLTMNTLLNDNELEDALKFAYDIYEIGVDAVIVQDLGLASLLHKAIPNLALHASTQLSTHTLEGVEELTKIGFSRVVLARELSIKEITYICENTNTEIEIFAHGALCVCYSGQCLLSSMIGDRSGNRGKCAQPCRLPYHLIENNKDIASGYLLSPKDLSTLDILKDLPNVACLKIEGRMKTPEYVATVVKTYRKYLDNLFTTSKSSKPSFEDKQNLAQVFNRGGFSNAYLYKKTGKDMMCYEKPKNWGIYLGKVTKYDGKRYIELDNKTNLKIGDGIEVWNNSNRSPSTIVSEIVGNKIGRIHGNINIGDKVYKTSDKQLIQSARESFSRGSQRKTPITLNIDIMKNQPIKIKIDDFTYISNIFPEIAEKQPLSEEKIISQFSKTGNTPFKVKDIKINFSNDIFLPVSILNEIRREAFESYENYLLSKTDNKIERKNINEFKNPNNIIPTLNPKKVSVFFYEFKKKYLNLKDIDCIYLNFRDIITKLDLIKDIKQPKYIVFPNITRGNYDLLIKKHLNTLVSLVDGFVLSNIGQLNYFKNLKTTLIANYTFNTFNTFNIELLKDLGFSKIILSPELTMNQINSLSNKNILEVIAYGNLCVMTSEYCPVGSLVGGLSTNKPCNRPCLNNKKYYLKDRMDINFRVIPDNIDCQSRIYNSKTTSIETKDISVSSIRLDFLDECYEEIQKIISVHKKGAKLSGENYTNGHLTRPV